MREVIPHIFVADDESPFFQGALKHSMAIRRKDYKITYLTTTSSRKCIWKLTKHILYHKPMLLQLQKAGKLN